MLGYGSAGRKWLFSATLHTVVKEDRLDQQIDGLPALDWLNERLLIYVEQ
jgi:hypothetical protein